MNYHTILRAKHLEKYCYKINLTFKIMDYYNTVFSLSVEDQMHRNHIATNVLKLASKYYMELTHCKQMFSLLSYGAVILTPRATISNHIQYNTEM